MATGGPASRAVGESGSCLTLLPPQEAACFGEESGCTSRAGQHLWPHPSLWISRGQEALFILHLHICKADRTLSWK